MKHVLRPTLAALAISVSNHAVAQAEPNDALFEALAQCIDAVNVAGLDALAGFDMAFDREEKPNSNATNKVYVGSKQTPLGVLSVEVRERNNVVFDCTTGSITTEENDVAYADAEPTLHALVDLLLNLDHAHEILTDTRFVGVVICPPGSGALSISATSMSPQALDVTELGNTKPIPGALRMAVFQTNPINFEFC